MTKNLEYDIHPATSADVRLVQAMAQICADGRIRAYGIKPGGPDYVLGVEKQLSEDGLEELRYQVRQSVDNPEHSRVWLAESRADRHLAGLCIVQAVTVDSDSHIYFDRIFVDRTDEGHGIASAFIDRVIDFADGRTIEGDVVAGNDRALGLYMRRGFKEAGRTEPVPGFETELERIRIVRQGEGKAV